MGIGVGGGGREGTGETGRRGGKRRGKEVEGRKHGRVERERRETKEKIQRVCETLGEDAKVGGDAGDLAGEGRSRAHKEGGGREGDDELPSLPSLVLKQQHGFSPQSSS